MKITVSRDEIKDMIRTKYGITSDFLLEISTENANTVKEVSSKIATSSIVERAKQSAPAPVVYDNPIKVDSSGFIVADSEEEKVVPVKLPSKAATKKSHHKKKEKVSRTCVICGKNFYTENEKAKTCSAHCRSVLVAKICKEKNIKCGRKATAFNEGPLPSNPKIDYSKYGIIIEQFLNSTGRTTSVDLEGLSPTGMCSRYATAAKMFGFRDKISLNANSKYNELTMSKIGVE